MQEIQKRGRKLGQAQENRRRRARKRQVYLARMTAAFLLEINDYSRPGTELEDVISIFVHYTAKIQTVKGVE